MKQLTKSFLIRGTHLSERLSLTIMLVIFTSIQASGQYTTAIPKVLFESHKQNILTGKIVGEREPIRSEVRKTPRKALSSIDKLTGECISQSLSLFNGIDMIGNSVKISKKNSTGLYIESFIEDATNSIEATVNLTDGTISIPSNQTLFHDSDYGDIVLVKYDSGVDYSSPITGVVSESGSILLTSEWVAVFTYNSNTYYYESGGMTIIRPANAKMRETPYNGTSKTYNVIVSQNAAKDSVNVINFGNHGQEISMKVNEDGTVIMPRQLIFDVSPLSDDNGTVTRDDFWSTAWTNGNSGFVLTTNEVYGSITSTEINFGNWGYADSYSMTGRFFTDARIYFTSQNDRLVLPGQSEDIEYTYNDVNYLLHTGNTATITFVEPTYGDLVIPSTVSYNGQNYTVTEVGSGILVSEEGFNKSVSFPSTITKVADDAFDWCETSAIIWNSNTPLPTKALTKVSSTWANMLLYVNKSGIAPSSFANTIVNGVAQEIELVEGYVFHCPKEFVARNISLSHEFKMQTVIGKKQGWETLALPFDVQTITHATKGHVVPFANYSPSSSDKPFWLYKWMSSGFTRASSIEANVPYLISMPNNNAYSPDYVLAGNVTFSSQNATVYTTTPEDLRSYGYNNKYFFAQYYFSSSSVCANINSVNALHTQTGGYDPGSIFVKNMRDVFPFEGYMYEDVETNARNVIEIEFADEDAQGIEGVNIAKNSVRGIYTLSGQRVNVDEGLAEEVLRRLPSGVYILNGNKVINN